MPTPMAVPSNATNPPSANSSLLTRLAGQPTANSSPICCRRLSTPKTNIKPVRITAEAIRNMLRPRNSSPKSVPWRLACMPRSPHRLKEQADRGRIDLARQVPLKLLCEPVPPGIAHGGQIPILVAPCVWPASRVMKALGVPRYSFQYCSSFGRILSRLTGMPGFQSRQLLDVRQAGKCRHQFGIARRIVQRHDLDDLESALPLQQLSPGAEDVIRHIN